MNTFLPTMGMQTETITPNRNLTVCNQCLTYIHDLWTHNAMTSSLFLENNQRSQTRKKLSYKKVTVIMLAK